MLILYYAFCYVMAVPLGALYLLALFLRNKRPRKRFYVKAYRLVVLLHERFFYPHKPHYHKMRGVNYPYRSRQSQGDWEILIGGRSQESNLPRTAGGPNRI